jgi:hypothetical protein
MNESIKETRSEMSSGSGLSDHQPVNWGGLAIRRKIIVTCVAVEFVAIAAAFFGVTPNVLWVAIAASTMSMIFAFVIVCRVFRSLVGTTLALLNALTCYRLWTVPFLISAGGLNKYLLVVVLSVRVIGWVALVIINRKASSVLDVREASVGP